MNRIFTKNEKVVKQVLADCKLNFSRTGDTYTLTGVSKPDGTPALLVILIKRRF